MSVFHYPRFLTLCTALVLGTAILLGTSSQAAAQLLISPLRVVFEGRDRSATVIVTNQSNEAATYRLEWQEKRATPDGQYRELTEEDSSAQNASNFVRFSPRQVTLAPGERQQIRLALRRTADMANGEYRSHLTFVVIDERERRAARRQNQGSGAAIQVFMNLGFAIPVMIRNGQASASVGLGGAELGIDELNRLGLKVQLRQEGSFSAYGRLRVFWRQNQGSPETQIGLLQNVAVFPDVESRLATVLLDWEQVPSGILRVVYEGADEYSGRTWIDQSFQIGN